MILPFFMGPDFIFIIYLASYCAENHNVFSKTAVAWTMLLLHPKISTAICFFSSHFGLSLSSSKATNDVASFWYLDQIENLLQAPVWCHCSTV